LRSPKENVYQAITKEPKEKLNLLVEDLKKTYNNSKHTFNTIIDFDVFIDAVKQAVKNKTIDYIIMGTNGKTGAKEVVFGSNTINVIRKINCKTIIIPQGYTFIPLKELLLVLNTKDVLNGSVFTELLEFIETYQFHLNVLRINQNHEPSENTLKDKFNLSLIDYSYTEVNGVPIDYAVSSYSQINSIDFTAIIIHKDSFFEHFFSNSTTSNIDVSEINKPLLALHANL